MSIRKLCDRLSRETSRLTMAAAEECLSEEEPWRRLVEERVGEMTKAEFHRSFALYFRRDVQPTNFLLAQSEDGSVEVLANLFDADRFASAWHSGRITPHNHSRPFVSRVLRGGYSEWRYDQSRNDGTDLRITSTRNLQCGDLCLIDTSTYHLVTLPDPETITLVIRGAATLPEMSPRPRASPECSRYWRERLLTAVAQRD